MPRAKPPIPKISPQEAAKQWPSSSQVVKGEKEEFQPLQTFWHKNAKPGQVTSINLSGGAKKSFYFSLGVNSTVPFVRLEGVGSTQKEFSWGETVEIPPGVTVNVRNSSKHAGDIEIQSGTDYAVPPSISFPVTFPRLASPNFFDPALAYLSSPIDTKRARRGWMYFGTGIDGGAVPPIGINVSISILGYYDVHTSGPNTQPVNIPQIPPATWASGFTWPAGSTMGAIPLGFNAGACFVPDSTIAMMLPDFLRVLLFHSPPVDDTLDLGNNFYAVLEYL